MKASEIENGDFLALPAWNTYGQVIGIEPAKSGSESSRRVMLQEHPEQRIADCCWYILDDGQFTLDN